MAIQIEDIRKSYPQYNDMSDADLLNALSKKMSGNFEDNNEAGFQGIAKDIGTSISETPNALLEMLKSLPQTAKQAGEYAIDQPLYKTGGQAGLGIAEALASLLSAPQSGARYLGKKFAPQSAFTKSLQQTPTPRELLQEGEEATGIAATTPQEQSVRVLADLLAGGKGLTKIPSRAGRISTVAAEQAGENRDPLQAALLGLAGETAFSGGRKAKQAAEKGLEALPKTLEEAKTMTSEKFGSIPEVTGSVASSALESLADLGTKAHIPGAQATLGALGAYIKYLSSDPEKFAKQKLFKDITPELIPLINERVEASQRLGLDYLTPAEATLSPFEAMKQGEIGKTSTGSKMLFEKGRARSESEQRAIEQLQENIYDPAELDPQKQAAYQQAMEARVPDEFIEKWMDDPVVESALKLLDSKPTYKRAVQGIPADSFEYWNIVKRVIGDMEKEDAQGMKKFSSDQATKTRNEMVDEMDKIQPEYKIARKIAEREFTRKEVEDFFDKRNMTGNEFQKFIKSKKQFNRLMDKLEPYPEAQQNLKDMKLLFGDLIPTDPSIRTAAQMKKTSMWDSRNKLDAFKRDLDERFGKRHDTAAVNLMTDPKWIDYLVEFLEKNKKKK